MSCCRCCNREVARGTFWNETKLLDDRAVAGASSGSAVGARRGKQRGGLHCRPEKRLQGVGSAPIGWRDRQLVGRLHQGLAQGAGTVLWSRDNRPFEKDEGSWERGRQTGRGAQDWGSGRYEGELAGGEPSGHGVMMLKTSRYEGEFRNGKPNGEGTVTNLQGLFKGIWKDGCLAKGKQIIVFAVSSSSCH
jgi:hypothetical protein